MRKVGKITAVIPVRSGSIRCKEKNHRTFGDTNLLERKIKQLQKIEDIDTIIVNSNCDHMLNIAKTLGVKPVKRDKVFATTETTATELYYALSQNIKTEIFMYVHVVCPFISTKDIKKMIKIYRNNTKNTSVISVHRIKEFMWKDGKPLNFNLTNIGRTQDLSNIAISTFGCNILDTQTIISEKNIYGSNPYFYYIDQIGAIDIDTQFDFIISELLYKNKLMNNDDLIDYLNKPKEIELLDCTIRDGGYINDWNFTDEEVLECYKSVTKAGYDYFEIGFKSNRKLLNKDYGKWCFLDDDEITNIKNKYPDGCKIATMVKIGTFKMSDFTQQKDSGIDLIRFLISRYYPEYGYKSMYTQELLEKSLQYIKEFIELGYDLCINFSCGNQITKEEFHKICKTFKPIAKDIKCIYLADTFGTFTPDIVKNKIYEFKTIMREHNTWFKLGFHAHNNCQNSVAKTIEAINQGCIIVDSCISGLGRGAGNLPTELLLLELNNEKYNIIPILEYLNKYIKSYNHKSTQKYQCEYNFLYACSAKLKCHPNYVNYLINEHDELSSLRCYELLVEISKYCHNNNDFHFSKDFIKFLLN